MIEVLNLKKTYKGKKGISVEALRGISIAFPGKGLVVVLGKSGCGKTTLLNILGTLDCYDDGDVIYNGLSLKNLSERQLVRYRAENIGFVFQDFLLIEDISIENNLKIAVEFQGGKATDEDIKKVLSSVDMTGFEKRKPSQLSNGQRQRIGIARALIKNANIILADEPTGNLDNENAKNIFELLKRISTEKLVIVVSHDEEYATNFADRIIRMQDGIIIDDKNL